MWVVVTPDPFRERADFASLLGGIMARPLAALGLGRDKAGFRGHGVNSVDVTVAGLGSHVANRRTCGQDPPSWMTTKEPGRSGTDSYRA